MTEITEEQKKLIQELREEVKDRITPKYDTDYNFLRWLKAFNFRKDEALQRLRRHLQFRKVLELDSLQDKFQECEVTRKFVPLGLVGPAGKDNKFLVIECVGRADPNGLIRSFQGRNFLLARFKFLEELYDAMNDEEKRSGKMSGVVYILDLEGLEFDPSLLPILTGPYHILWDRIGDNYPEWIHKFLIVNVPTFMSVLWKAFYPFIPENTREKIIVTGENWKETVLQYVAPDKLPVHWGGTMTDANGDEMCRSKLVIPTEKIPQELYWKPGPNDPCLEDLKDVNIGAGVSVMISYYVTDPETIMQIYLYGEQEYTFGIYFAEDPEVEDTENMEDIFPNCEFPGMVTMDTCTIHCEKAGTYHMKLGNEKAWFMGVLVKYQMNFVDEKGNEVHAIPMNPEDLDI